MEVKTLEGLVLNHLIEKKSITSMEAFVEYGATRLSAIIYNLRKKGYEISAHSESSKNRYGRPVTYTRYSLVKHI